MLIIKGGNGPELVADEGQKGEDDGEKEKRNKEDEKEENEEEEMKSKREVVGRYSKNLLDAMLEEKVFGRKADKSEKNGFEQKNAKRRVLRKVDSDDSTRGGNVYRRRRKRRSTTTREKDWNSLPDIWMTLGKQVRNFLGKQVQKFSCLKTFSSVCLFVAY